MGIIVHAPAVEVLELALKMGRVAVNIGNRISMRWVRYKN